MDSDSDSDKDNVPRLVFDEANYGIKPWTPKTFAKEKLLDDPRPVPSLSKSNMDEEDINDMEITSLMSRIKRSVDDLVVENTEDPKARKRMLLQKIDRLAGIERKNHASYKVRVGMLKKEKERAVKQCEQMRLEEAVVSKSQQLCRKIKERRMERKKRRHGGS